jgi:hypothetical protein
MGQQPTTGNGTASTAPGVVPTTPGPTASSLSAPTPTPAPPTGPTADEERATLFAQIPVQNFRKTEDLPYVGIDRDALAACRGAIERCQYVNAEVQRDQVELLAAIDKLLAQAPLAPTTESPREERTTDPGPPPTEVTVTESGAQPVPQDEPPRIEAVPPAEPVPPVVEASNNALKGVDLALNGFLTEIPNLISKAETAVDTEPTEDDLEVIEEIDVLLDAVRKAGYAGEAKLVEPLKALRMHREGLKAAIETAVVRTRVFEAGFPAEERFTDPDAWKQVTGDLSKLSRNLRFGLELQTEAAEQYRANILRRCEAERARRLRRPNRLVKARRRSTLSKTQQMLVAIIVISLALFVAVCLFLLIASA